MSVNTKYIMLFEQFIIEKDAIDATEYQLQKAKRRAQKYADKAGAANYDIKFKEDKLEFEKKKDAIQREIDSKTDPVAKALSKEKLKALEAAWKQTKQKYKDRITKLKGAAKFTSGRAEMP